MVWQWKPRRTLYLESNHVAEFNTHALLQSRKWAPAIKPPGGLIFSKHFWEGGGLKERGHLFNLVKRITFRKSTAVWDRVDLPVVQLKSLSKVFNSLVGA